MIVMSCRFVLKVLQGSTVFFAQIFFYLLFGQSYKPSTIKYYDSRVILTKSCLECDSRVVIYDQIAF